MARAAVLIAIAAAVLAAAALTVTLTRPGDPYQSRCSVVVYNPVTGQPGPARVPCQTPAVP